MSRYLTERAMGLLVVAMLLIAAMVWLGWWQYGAYDDHRHDDAAEAAESDPVPLDEALGPDAGFSSDDIAQAVVVTGHYNAEEQFYVEDLDGSADTYAVVTPLVTTSGSAVLVVRGSSDTTGVAAPSGDIEVHGRLEPSQSQAQPLDDDRVTDGIRISTLVSDIDEDLYGGYVVLTQSDPADALTPVEAPLPDPSRWAGIRNLIYAIQWWLFALFVGFMWWRIVNDADRETTEGVR